MQYPDLDVVDVAPALGQFRPSDPSLMFEARIKAKKLRDFLGEVVERLEDRVDSASPAIIRDYNVLRALVVEASPRLVAILPPEVPIPHPGVTSGPAPVVTNRELLFFCHQIKDYLDHRIKQHQEGGASGDPAPVVDNGASLFGPDGLKHEPSLLAAARAKAQTLLDFVKRQLDNAYGADPRVPASLLDDYNRLLALIRDASPEIDSLLPPEIRIPADPKPRPDDQPAPSLGSRFFSLLRGDGRPRTPRYSELSYSCQQIARLLK